MGFFLRHLYHKWQEQNKGLNATIVDSTMSWSGLWPILGQRGRRNNILQMVIQLHENQNGRIRLNGDMSDLLPFNDGVKQVCVPELTHLSILFSMMLRQLINDLDEEDRAYKRFLWMAVSSNYGAYEPTSKRMRG